MDENDRPSEADIMQLSASWRASQAAGDPLMTGWKPGKTSDV